MLYKGKLQLPFPTLFVLHMLNYRFNENRLIVPYVKQCITFCCFFMFHGKSLGSQHFTFYFVLLFMTHSLNNFHFSTFRLQLLFFTVNGLKLNIYSN